MPRAEACRSIASTTFPKMFCCLTLLTTKANDDNDYVQTHTYVVCFHYFVKLPQVRLKRLLKYLLHTSCHLLSVLLKILSKRRLALHHNSLFLGYIEMKMLNVQGSDGSWAQGRGRQDWKHSILLTALAPFLGWSWDQREARTSAATATACCPNPGPKSIGKGKDPVGRHMQLWDTRSQTTQGEDWQSEGCFRYHQPQLLKSHQTST